jgi:hypothetical protein
VSQNQKIEKLNVTHPDVITRKACAASAMRFSGIKIATESWKYDFIKSRKQDVGMSLIEIVFMLEGSAWSRSNTKLYWLSRMARVLFVAASRKMHAGVATFALIMTDLVARAIGLAANACAGCFVSLATLAWVNSTTSRNCSIELPPICAEAK